MRQHYGPEVDWWGLGIVMYMMMTGDTPFGGSTRIFYDKISYEPVRFPPYLTRNALSILSGVSVINMKTEALGVL